MEWCRKTKTMKPFLVDNKELGREFRNLFLVRLNKLIEQGKIRIEEAGYVADLIGELRLKDWVAFIEGPPKPDCPPSQMLKYLTRYLTGGPISNGRIVGERDGRIYFMARSKRKDQGQVEVSLSKVEFVQQWCLHIPPKDFTKTRHFGAWSGSKRKEYIDRCKELAPPLTASLANQPLAHSKDAKKPIHSCPHCGCEMKCTVNEERPSWRELFYGPDHPSWYEWTSRGLNVPPDDPPDDLYNDHPDGPPQRLPNVGLSDNTEDAMH
jgi:hypothetical protein